MLPSDFNQAVSARLSQLLLSPEGRRELERFRYAGSTNRVYRVPIQGDEFVMVKLLPSWLTELRIAAKQPVRNLLYGERDARVGRRRVRWEPQRYREWAAAGIPVPPLVDSPFEGVRVIKGLPHPTFYTVLTDPTFTHDARIRALRIVTRGLAHQHRTALDRGQKGLVHRDPGPWNVLVDLAGSKAYWYDLEHPDEYPGTTVRDLVLRGLRIYAFGVLDYLPDDAGEVLQVMVEEYEPRDLLGELADVLLRNLQGRPQRLLRRLGLRRARAERQRQIALGLREALGARTRIDAVREAS